MTADAAKIRGLGAGMKYVELRSGSGDGEQPVLADPRPCLTRLPGIAAGLPPSARAFAADRGGPHRPRGDLTDRGGTSPTEGDLLVRHTGVSRIQSDVLDGCDPASLGGVIRDEILPLPGGCTREVACRPGRLGGGLPRPGGRVGTGRLAGCGPPGGVGESGRSFRSVAFGSGGRGLGWSGDDPGS
ncbi:hypothetical protein ACFWN1_04470 [Streptomyces sp. NPDC058459]|uniref:hypothetical protein n=1 Tax=Streptomyces sp. NPDC058459 TaxID=3346508 RepID=UPI0036517FA7